MLIGWVVNLIEKLITKNYCIINDSKHVLVGCLVYSNTSTTLIYNCNKDSVLVEGNDDSEFQAAFLKYRSANNNSKFKYSKILP